MPSHTARAGLALVGVAASIMLAGCGSDSSATEPTTSTAESTSAEARAGSEDCAPTVEYYEQSLYGREWLLAYKQQPSSGVTLRRCHYSPTMDTGPLAGHLDQPPSVVSDSPEVEGILLPLPDSTDNYLWRCPSAYVTAFSEYTVLDQTGTPVAKFRMTDGGSCSSPHVMP